MAALLEVNDLRAGYGSTPVLHGLSLEVAEGGITTVLGANGAGKTTL
jgi:branched-chain amino acid transport system ATP-binding protein